MNKNNTIKVKSITDVITNSSTEVFTFYNDGGIKTIKDTVNAILAINSDNKYTFDDLFEIKYDFDFDYIDDDWYDDKLCLYLTDEENHKLVEYKASSEYQDRRYDKYLPFLNNEVSYDSLKKMAFEYEDEDYEKQGTVVCGVDITAKKDSGIKQEIIDNAVKCLNYISSDSIWEQEARYDG